MNRKMCNCLSVLVFDFNLNVRGPASVTFWLGTLLTQKKMLLLLLVFMCCNVVMNIKVKPRNKQNEAKFYTSTKTFTRLKIFFTTENKS